MRFAGCEHDILRALASMPFLERLEMVALTGWSRGAVYEAVAALEAGGFSDSALHAVDPLPPGTAFPPHRQWAAQARRGGGQAG